MPCRGSGLGRGWRWPWVGQHPLPNGRSRGAPNALHSQPRGDSQKRMGGGAYTIRYASGTPPYICVPRSQPSPRVARPRSRRRGSVYGDYYRLDRAPPATHPRSSESRDRSMMWLARGTGATRDQFPFHRWNIRIHFKSGSWSPGYAGRVLDYGFRF